jgi:hypothetical protein
LLLPLNLELESPDFLEKAVHLELLFVLELLVKLSQTGGPIVVRITRGTR